MASGCAAGWRGGPLWIAGGLRGSSGAIAHPGGAGGALVVHGSGTIRRMTLVWVGVAVAAVVLLVVMIKRLVASGGRKAADTDLGTVSEAWLSDERGRKDS